MTIPHSKASLKEEIETKNTNRAPLFLTRN